ncbi:MAG: sulfotransferase [Leptolyngbyaceae cyanobacterium SL_1_1]|nr:sulfotransferase [Leptolyngbyaceae cyanobacterium SM1_4_3]NJN01336.1 sulfotransferase [Leptolyngbyaceae cyanobacterium RM1_1_2]NJO10686.1 sulfotransferase [Leptolyngbyaceae cyanobacterium SL_1_1]
MRENLTNESPIFVVGMPRSGTTLFSSMLSSHSCISISPESHFLSYWVKKNSYLNIDCHKDFKFFWEQFSKSKRFSYFGVNADKVLSRILSEDELSYKVIFTSLLREYVDKMGKSRWGEKTPAHYSHVDQLLTWYPKARIIWMVRDPKAVVSSLLKVEWASSHAYVNAETWRDSMLLFDEKWSKDRRVKLLKYEDIVVDPESKLREICEFIDEDYDSVMLERSEESSPIINRTGWADTHLRAALKPVNSASLEKWRSSLSTTQVAVVEKITRDTMIKYGYKASTHGLNVKEFIQLIAVKRWRKISQFLSRRSPKLKYNKEP